MAKEHGVTHLLAGDGGDELFAGNTRYTEQDLFERYFLVPAALRRGVVEPILRGWPDIVSMKAIRRARSYVAQAKMGLPARLEACNFIYRHGAENIFDANFLAVIDQREPFHRMKEVWDATPGESLLHHMLYYDWTYTLADNDLRKVETMSALAGVRVSYPMLHPDVVELSTMVPPEMLMPKGQLRHFFKSAMEGYLPREILDKKKHGFGLPFGLWLRDSSELRERIFGNISQIKARRIFRPDFLDQLLQLHRGEDPGHYGKFIWVVAMLEQWMREHSVSV
jgi:asparagine synthase (glutamine-hydrolysing)